MSTTCEIFEMFGQSVVDLIEYAEKPLPEGWHFILDDNAYTGWNGSSGGIRYACVYHD